MDYCLQSKISIAWFTRMPCEGKFIPSAYLTRLVVPELLKDPKIEVKIYSNISDPNTYFKLASGKTLQVHHYLSVSEYDVSFNQVEEGVGSHFLRMCVGLYPGIVFFHDLYLSDLGPDPVTNSPYTFIKKLMSSKEDTLDIEWPNKSQEFPRSGAFATRESALSWTACFSSARLRNDFARSDFGKSIPSMFIPYPIDIDSNDSSKNDVSSANNYLAICGTPNIEDQLYKLLAAIRMLSTSLPIVWMVDKSYEVSAKKLIEEFRISNVNLVSEFTTDNWQKIVKDAKVCSHLHFSVYGQVSPFIEISLQAGKSILMTDFGDSDYYSKDQVFMIPPNDYQTNIIYNLLSRLMNIDSDIQYNKESKFDFVLSNNNPQLIGLEYISMFRQIHLYLKKCSDTWSDVKARANTSLLNQVEDSVNNFQRVFDEMGWR